MSYEPADQAASLRAAIQPRRATARPILLWLRHASHLGPVALCTALAGIAAAHAVRLDGAWQALLVAVVALNVGLLALSSWPAILGFVLGAIGDAFGRTSAHGRVVSPGELVPSWPTGRARTAILVPIYEEDPARVFAAVEVMRASLAVTGAGEAAFFVLSDTRRPEAAEAEEDAYRALLARLAAEPGRGRAPVHYRRRAANTRRKAGNITEFLERWGAAYDFMVVLDADSLMTGAAIARMIGTMEANPRAGVVQTMPYAVGRESLFARIQQFAGRLYGPPLARGLAFWQGPRGGYWGHNAIIRIQPFMAHCGLPDLPGRAPLGGEILCHDTVEAALMLRAGWDAWLVPGIEGSYEETPTNLLDHLVRERRWCQGNLQHLRVLRAHGLKLGSVLHIGTGILHYLSAPLLLASLGLSTLLDGDWGAAADAASWEWVLLALVLGLMFAPKLLAVGAVLGTRGGATGYGGARRLVASALLEQVFSTLVGPVLTVFYAVFVATTLMGRVVRWDAQARDDRGLGWREAARRLGLPLAVGTVAAGLMAALGAPWAWLPLVPGLVLGVPLAVLSSRASLGRTSRRAGLFVMPEEAHPGRNLAALARAEAAARAATPPAGANRPAPGTRASLPPEVPGSIPAQELRPAKVSGTRQRQPAPGGQGAAATV
jgi:membrane glycosyltransferase